MTDVDDQEGDLCVIREEFLLDAGEVCAGHGAGVQAEGADCGDEVACLQVSAQLSGGGGKLLGGVEALDEAGSVGLKVSARSTQFASAERIAVTGAAWVLALLPSARCATRRSRASGLLTQVMRRGWLLKAVGP